MAPPNINLRDIRKVKTPKNKNYVVASLKGAGKPQLVDLDALALKLSGRNGLITHPPSFSLDKISDVQGSVLYRGAAAWEALPPATTGQFLQTNGAAANPSWESAATGGSDYLCVPPLSAHNGTTFNSGFWGGRSAVAPENCTITALCFIATAASASAQIVPAIYSNTATIPDVLLKSGSLVTGAVQGLNTIPLTSGLAITTGDILWIGFLVQTANISFAAAGSIDNAFFAEATTTPPNPASAATYPGTNSGSWGSMWMSK